MKVNQEKQRILAILAAKKPSDIAAIQREASAALRSYCGDKVFFRGLIEFSNHCASDCSYCGIRRGNKKVRRYLLSHEQMVDAGVWAAAQGYGSLVLQSGERRDEEFVAFVEDAVRTIKQKTVSELLPQGLGVTLSVGEQSEATYRRWFAAGAHRYLLRIETSSPELFTKIHPPSQTLAARIACLNILKSLGFQVGTGVMIGLPGQTLEHLADDILFFKELDVDMIGMGPYIVHADTPMAAHAEALEPLKDDTFRLSLLMIAACRISLRDVNIAAATALQAMLEDGREQGLLFGANVIMPQLTPTEFRRDYLLYEGKPCLDENAQMCRSCLEIRIKSIGREIGYNEWGDSQHFRSRQETTA